MRTPQGLPTASRLQLAATCAASQVLPVIDTAWESGAAGHERHDVLQEALTSPPGAYKAPTPALESWLEDVLEVAEQLRHPDLRSEAAYAYNVARFDGVTGAPLQPARLLGYHMGRFYKQSPTEFAGATDFILVEPTRVVVIDLKTGQSETPHPARNMQLRMLALAAARTHGVDNARVGILHAAPGQAVWWSWASFDAFDLEEIAVELHSLSQRIGYARNDVERGKTPRLTVGEHCNNCPARHGCPARVAMAKRLAGEPEKVVLDLKAMLTPESAAIALTRWRAAKKALEEVGGALYAYASENPIPLGDGRVWGPVTSEREVIDAEKAWAVLEAKYGYRIARAAMTLETSKAGVDRAMHELRESARGAAERPMGIGPGKITIKGLNQDALDALRAVEGCVTKKTVTEYEEHAVALPSGEASATT